MSYILDALKKAESERRIGSIPDMHAQPLATASATDSPAWRRPYAWATLAGVVLMAGGIAWFAPWQAARRSDTGALPTPQSSSGTVAIDTNRNAAPTPPAVSQKTVPPIAQAVVPEETVPPVPQQTAQPEPAKPKPEPAPVKKKKSEPPPAIAAPAPQATASKKENAPAAAAPPAAVAPAAEPRLPGFRDLPANIQQEIPALTVGGYIYSSIAAERSLLINNRLLREGSEISHGLVLEKMLPKEAVLNYKGYRYRVPY